MLLGDMGPGTEVTAECARLLREDACSLGARSTPTWLSALQSQNGDEVPKHPSVFTAHVS